MTTAEQDDTVRGRLGTALRAALRARDQAATAALRSALAAIANAEAVSADTLPPAPAPASSPHFAGAAAGPDASEVPRRVISEPAMTEIVRAEMTDRRQAAGQYAQAGHADRAACLTAEADVLAAVLGAKDTSA